MSKHEFMSGKEEKEAIRAAERAKNLAKMQMTNQMPSIPGQQYSLPPLYSPLTNVSAPVVYSSTKTKPDTLSTEDLLAELLRRKEELKKKVNSMVLDADAYRVNLSMVRLLTEDQSPADRIKYLGAVAHVTSVPILVLANYLGELYGFSQEIDTCIASLSKYYKDHIVTNVKRV